MTVMEDLKNSINTRLAALFPTFQELDYVEEVENNNWNQIEKGYGTRALTANEIDGVNKRYTVNQVYEVILTERYLHSSTDETHLQSTSFDLRSKCLDIYKDMINTKAGLPSEVMNVHTVLIDEPEVETESKVIIQRMEFSIIYRITL